MLSLIFCIVIASEAKQSIFFFLDCFGLLPSQWRDYFIDYWIL